jgi:hypothetical protein
MKHKGKTYNKIIARLKKIASLPEEEQKYLLKEAIETVCYDYSYDYTKKECLPILIRNINDVIALMDNDESLSVIQEYKTGYLGGFSDEGLIATIIEANINLGKDSLKNFLKHFIDDLKTIISCCEDKTKQHEKNT